MEFESKFSQNRMAKGSNLLSSSRPNNNSYPSRAPPPRDSTNTGTNLPTAARAPPSSIQTSANATSTRHWDAERQNRIAKGLCFRCNEKFGPGHRCKTGSLSLLELTDGNEGADRDEDNTPDDIPDSGSQADLAEISFNAILGKSAGTTMKLQGTICNREVLILVDSGSTHNFVAENIVKELKLPVQFVPSFGVQIGNGEVIRCNRVCQNVEV